MKIPVSFTVNGDRYSVMVPPDKPLLKVLRDDLGMTETKPGCGRGDCGACTVHVNGRPVNSCLFLAIDADGTDIRTVAGLARKGKLHPVQEAFIEEGAIQCGFCTPGMVMQAVALLERNPSPTVAEIRKNLEGNICRCTGYRKIEKAVLSAAAKMKENQGS
jgi:aerobic-type carbon monoxide dehydrogenase small subunit (CoxS/CutS family)